MMLSFNACNHVFLNFWKYQAPAPAPAPTPSPATASEDEDLFSKKQVQIIDTKQNAHTHAQKKATWQMNVYSNKFN